MAIRQATKPARADDGGGGDVMRVVLFSLALLLTAITFVGCDDGGTSSSDASDAASTSVAAATVAPPADAAGVIEQLGVMPVFTNFPYRNYDWSPDGRSIAYIGLDQSLYVADAPDYASRRLAAGPAKEPRWSPDGQLVAFASQDEGIAVASRDLTDDAYLVSPPDDEWRTRINLVDRWIGADTIAYQVHCGTGCALLFELTVARPESGPPTLPGALREVPVLNDAPYPTNAAGGYHYSDDASAIVADYGGWPAVFWYDRETGDRWHIAFDDDPTEPPDVMREFVRWNPDGTFVFRQATGAEQQATWFASSGLAFAGTYWRADPNTRTVVEVTAPD
jgi:hypothetical protein